MELAARRGVPHSLYVWGHMGLGIFADRVVRSASIAVTALILAGCNAEQSMLHPAGEDAAAISNLFWAMAIGAALIWLLVMGTTVYAVLGRRRPTSEKFADRFILFGGVAFPTVTLAILLVFGLALLPDWVRADTPDLRVHVTAEQYWWRIGYEQPDGTIVETANELHLPNGQTAEFVLNSTDVIHAFWIPALGGKIDIIPGRTNLWRLKPTDAGVYRGVCAEFCGPSHALMAFPVVVHDPVDFAAWLEGEVAPATSDNALIQSAGCAACHAVRGTDATGRVGPDLTHFASRRTMAAGTLPITADNLATWLLDPDHIKPDARMPGYAMLPESERAALVSYLLDLK
jgi:cytochrome c oxidase subunit 2